MRKQTYTSMLLAVITSAFCLSSFQDFHGSLLFSPGHMATAALFIPMWLLSIYLFLSGLAKYFAPKSPFGPNSKVPLYAALLAAPMVARGFYFYFVLR